MTHYESPEEIGRKFADELLSGIREQLGKMDWPVTWLVELLSGHGVQEVWIVTAMSEEGALDKIEDASGWRRKTKVRGRARNYNCFVLDTSRAQQICRDEEYWRPVYSCDIF